MSLIMLTQDSDDELGYVQVSRPMQAAQNSTAETRTTNDQNMEEALRNAREYLANGQIDRASAEVIQELLCMVEKMKQKTEAGDSNQNMNNDSGATLSSNDYTVALICNYKSVFPVISTFLDEEHGEPMEVQQSDNNTYRLGRVGRHNVIVTCLPFEEYGAAPAANAGISLINSFPNVKVGILVGIGGGAPTMSRDIRLGDIVVSTPVNGHNSVVQLDLGKTTQDTDFRATGFLNQPPRLLRATVNYLRARYEFKGHQLSSAIYEVLEKYPRRKRKYRKPDPKSDRLYKSDFVHTENCCKAVDEHLRYEVFRTTRSRENSPSIHYGTIGSWNQILKDAIIRDRLAKERNIIAFNMEAAGLMNHFPCLVVQGICSYSDSHESDQWQAYAALTASSYVKDLLNALPLIRYPTLFNRGDVPPRPQNNSTHLQGCRKEPMYADPDDYEIGWICAVYTEFVAAMAFLDEEHKQLEFIPPHNHNTYALGRMGQHNIAITLLPEGEYGTASAAALVTEVQHTFRNIRLGLMVGIGGGVPTAENDIRLGDVVVGMHKNGWGGIFSYDSGTTLQNQGFYATGHFDSPPRVLQVAVVSLRASYERQGHQINKTIHELLEKHPRLKRFKRPDASKDRLYRADVVHSPNSGNSACVDACGTDSMYCVSRPDRDPEVDDDPVIHYGTIASGNQVMKDARIRDKIAAEQNVLCFEMEAAGIANIFPSLVIRGICDYADSHKNKEWQGYAAMTAAAYAKDLLQILHPIN